MIQRRAAILTRGSTDHVMQYVQPDTDMCKLINVLILARGPSLSAVLSYTQIPSYAQISVLHCSTVPLRALYDIVMAVLIVLHAPVSRLLDGHFRFSVIRVSLHVYGVCTKYLMGKIKSIVLFDSC